MVTEELKKQPDVRLRLFARNTASLSAAGNVTLMRGDAMDYDTVREAVSGQDIVYVNLAGNLEAMAENIVRAMKEAGVKRIIAVSSIGIYHTPLKAVLKPYRALADVVESSGLAYTILRPDWFTHGNEVSYMLTHKGQPEAGFAISRKSIAAFIGTLVQNPSLHVNENLGISKP